MGGLFLLMGHALADTAFAHGTRRLKDRMPQAVRDPFAFSGIRIFMTGDCQTMALANRYAFIAFC